MGELVYLFDQESIEWQGLSKESLGTISKAPENGSFVSELVLKLPTNARKEFLVRTVAKREMIQDLDSSDDDRVRTVVQSGLEIPTVNEYNYKDFSSSAFDELSGLNELEFSLLDLIKMQGPLSSRRTLVFSHLE